MNELALFNDLFNGFDDGGYFFPTFKKATQAPKVDIKQDKDNYTLKMDLPGKTEKDVDIELNNNVLTISSVKEATKEEKSDDKKDKKDGEKWLVKERMYSSFSRSFALPEDVEADKVEANVKDGILTVTMPRKPVSTPKKIAVKGN